VFKQDLDTLVALAAVHLQLMRGLPR
jgi:hypothetical protein